MRKRNYTHWIIGFTALLTMGCNGTSSDVPAERLPALEQIQGGLYLEKAASCDDLETYIKDLQLEGMKNNLMGGGYYGGGSVSVGMDMDIALTEPAMAESSGSASGGDDGSNNSASPAPQKGIELDENYTGTNNQEATVDEADIVKTDGEHIYILRNASLLITTAWPTDSIDVVSATGIEGNPSQMFVQDDTIAVFSSIWDTWSLEDKLGKNLAESNIYNLTKITLLDISDRANPQVIREVYAEGNYQSARLVGQTARVVVSSQITLDSKDSYSGSGGISPSVGAPVSVSTSSSGGSFEDDREEVSAIDPPSAEPSQPEPDTDSEDGEAVDSEDGDEAGKADLMIVIKTDGDDETINADNAEEAMVLLQLQAIKEMIDAQTLETLLPTSFEVIHNADGTLEVTESFISECENHYKPSVDAGMNLLSVITIDMGAPAEKRTAATVIGEAGLIYSSANALYIASNLWTGWLNTLPDATEDFVLTAIHKFDISTSGEEALYAGTGSIPGTVLNQFSMSEFEGNLRVAHTRDNWNDGSSENNVSVLSPNDDGQLDVVGTLEGLAPGERIYSARFMGEKGYVVTFETVDPLFTIDLSDPTNPTLVGELKIPGFSTYIHPLGNDHLLTIGQNTEENEWGGISIQGIQLTIFDISDFANPSQAHKIVLDSSAWSQAVYESKAFTFHAESGLLALPLSGWGSSEGFGTSTQPVLDLEEEETSENETDEEGFVDEEYKQNVGLALYAVDSKDGFDNHGFVDHSSFLEGNYGWEEVRRSLIMGDHVYSIGNLGMKVAASDTVEEVASLEFPSEDEFYSNQEGGDKGWIEEENMPMEDTQEIPAPSEDGEEDQS